jgi:hypothetical protein
MEYVGNNNVILFGGHAGEATNALWRYDVMHHTWANLTDSMDNAPPARSNFAMSGIPIDNTIILFGGRGMLFNYDDTWQLDLVSLQWTEYNKTGETPSRRGFTAMCAISAGELVLFGGGDGVENGTDKFLYNDMWQYDTENHNWFVLQQ